MFDPHGPLPRFVDLAAMGERLSDRPEYARLSHLIAAAVRANSCVSDLKRAEQCCDTLERRPFAADINPDDTGAIENALLVQAASLYARATVTHSAKGERGAISIDDRLTPEQLADHRFIAEVRNQGGAHVYPNRTIEGQVWHGAHIFLVETPSRGWLQLAFAEEIQFNRALLLAMQRQIPVARNLLAEVSQKRLTQINELMTANPVSIEAFLADQVDPIPYFSGEDGVRAALAGFELGGMHGFRRW